MKRVAMIGVGKLGQDCAEVMAQAGHDVVGYDISPRNPAFPMMPTIEEAVRNRDLIFIAAPTPHDPVYGGETPTSHLPNKDFDYTIVTDILNEVNKYVTQNQLVVLISTVLPGTVRSLLRPCISNARFIYNPYLIAMGTVKWDMVNPEMVIIGTDDGSVTGDAKELIDFYAGFMQNDPRYEVGTWDEAESIKIFYNTFISTKLALVNMIQDVAETNGNINVDVVTNALAKSTHRIMGPAYMKAGLGDAGACHPRDNIALRYLAERLDLGYDLFDSIMSAREIQAERMALRCLKNGKNITIVGKAYKPGVAYLNGSASMLIGYYIEKNGGTVRYYDRNTGDNDLNEDWTDVYLIGYWDTFVEQIKFPNHCTVIDPWRKLTTQNHHGEIIHYGDTRAKPSYPREQMLDLKEVYSIYPELSVHQGKIHIVYAGVNPVTSFINRPFEEIVEELTISIKNGATKIIFDCMAEGVLLQVVHKIHRLASVLKGIIEPKKFFYFTGATDGDKAYDRIFDRLKLWDEKITVVPANYFEYNTLCYSRGFENVVQYEVKPKEKLFLCFNKINREHRMMLLEEVLKNNLLDRAYYSFEGAEDWKHVLPNLSDKYANIRNIQHLFPLRLNINENRYNPVNIIADDIKYFTNSYFSVVTETLYFENTVGLMYHNANAEPCIFPSEKIYKCMVMMHPFIVLGRPGFLKSLRENGYKTFSPFIDESYDDITDDTARLNHIVNEIKRLGTLTTEQMLEWQQNVKDIVIHNKDRFVNHSKFGVVADVVKYFEN